MAERESDERDGAGARQRRPHDSAYKYLFSSRRVVHQFLTRFVDEEFTRGLTPEDVRRFESSFVYGGERWTVPGNVRELIVGSIPSRYIPAFEYYPVIEHDIPDETLEWVRGLVAAVVYLEKRRDRTDSRPERGEIDVKRNGRSDH